MIRSIQCRVDGVTPELGRPMLGELRTGQQHLYDPDSEIDGCVCAYMGVRVREMFVGHTGRHARSHEDTPLTLSQKMIKIRDKSQASK